MSIATLKQQLIAELKHDRKRACVLALLTLACLLVVGRLVVRRLGASPASAAPLAKPGAPTMPGKPPAGDAQPDKTRPAVARAEPGAMRDLFRPNEEVFPPPLGTPVRSADTSQPEDADAREREKRQFVQNQARLLMLQATIVSDRSTARINGRTLTIGDEIDGFRVAEITTRSCTLVKLDVPVVLEMKTEGQSTP